MLGIFCIHKNDREEIFSNNGDFLESTGLEYERVKSTTEENYLITYDYSYYKYDEKKDEYTTDPMFRMQPVILEPNSTVLIITDPWRDALFDEVNKDLAENVDKYTMPLIRHALDNGVSIVVFTNNPDLVTYNTKIDKNIETLVEAGEISLFYYDEFELPGNFGEYLKKMI